MLFPNNFSTPWLTPYETYAASALAESVTPISPREVITRIGLGSNESCFQLTWKHRCQLAILCNSEHQQQTIYTAYTHLFCGD